MTTRTTTNRGGKRTGAGRPLLGTAPRISRSVSFSVEVLDYLDACGPNVSEAIDRLVRKGQGFKKWKPSK